MSPELWRGLSKLAWLISVCVLALWVPAWVLVSLAKPAAEADGVEEAAVAQGLRVAAAKLGQTTLCQLGATASVHFDSGRRKRGLWKNRGLFGLLEGKRAERGCTFLHQNEPRQTKWLFLYDPWSNVLISSRKNKWLKLTANSYKWKKIIISWIKIISNKCWGVLLLTWQPCKHIMFLSGCRGIFCSGTINSWI